MLTVLQEKLAEAHGLAMSAAVVAGKVEERTLDLELRRRLWRMQEDAGKVRARCLELERSFGEELAGELLAHANTTHEHAAELVGAWFKAGTGPLQAWTFLAMGEAAEVAVWLTLQTLAAKADDEAALRLATWALPVQRAHLDTALSGAARLAELRDPAAPRWG
jgi:hypothetical protein